MKLYHYAHCPFCIRVRMVLGFLNIKYESVVLPYDDEETPLKLKGKKMLPILDFGDSIDNESLDIIRKLDLKNKLQTTKVLNDQLVELNRLTDQIGKEVHSLAMPYWIWTPEFTEKSRAYFQNKKEQKRGPFKDLVAKKSVFIDELNLILSQLELSLDTFYKSKTLTLADIIMASHLWGMYIVPEFQFSPTLHSYLQRIAKSCKFNYHEDFWR